MKEKRIQQIMSYLYRNGASSYKELAVQCGSSISTVRRDIDLLENQGKLQKRRGGVVPVPLEADSQDDIVHNNFQLLPTINSAVKDRLAKYASSLVEDRDIVFIGSGTTVAHMMKYLRTKHDITVITNNVYVINEAMKYSFRVMCIGGLIDPGTLSSVGVQSIKEVERMHATKAFMSANGISLNAGVSNSSELEADIKRAAISISVKSYLLVDSSKFDQISLYTFAHIDEFDTVITDKEPDRRYREILQNRNRELIIVDK